MSLFGLFSSENQIDRRPLECLWHCQEESVSSQDVVSTLRRERKAAAVSLDKLIGYCKIGTLHVSVHGLRTVNLCCLVWRCPHLMPFCPRAFFLVWSQGKLPWRSPYPFFLFVHIIVLSLSSESFLPLSLTATPTNTPPAPPSPAVPTICTVNTLLAV